MEKTQDKSTKTEQPDSQSKAEWKVPELTVISIDKTNSGVLAFGPMEGTFYLPS